MNPLIRQPITSSESKSFQTELKYTAPAHLTKLALRILEGSCDPDGKYPVGVISSIYYDTQFWDFLGEKRDSDYLKVKIRLRWYEQNTPGDLNSQSYAEVKYRIGTKRVKYRIQTSLDGQYLKNAALNADELRRIPEQLAARGASIPQPIYPAFIVRYTRQRFIDRLTGARICLDYGITSPKTNPFMIANSHPCALPVSVLEVKGSDGAFPLCLNSMKLLGFRKEAFSKYYECYRLLTRTVF